MHVLTWLDHKNKMWEKIQREKTKIAKTPIFY